MHIQHLLKAVVRDAREAEAVPEHRSTCEKQKRARAPAQNRGRRGRRNGREWRRRVLRVCEEVDAEVEGASNGGAGDVAGDVAEDVAECGADKADGEARVTEVAELHCLGWC